MLNPPFPQTAVKPANCLCRFPAGLFFIFKMQIRIIIRYYTILIISLISLLRKGNSILLTQRISKMLHKDRIFNTNAQNSSFFAHFFARVSWYNNNE